MARYHEPLRGPYAFANFASASRDVISVPGCAADGVEVNLGNSETAVFGSNVNYHFFAQTSNDLLPVFIRDVVVFDNTAGGAADLVIVDQAGFSIGMDSWQDDPFIDVTLPAFLRRPIRHRPRTCT